MSDLELIRVISDQLPARPLSVLVHLLDGCSEKEIAQKLDLSVHTVHAHVKHLHQHFGVQTRGELLAKVYKRMFAALRAINDLTNP
ncbi:MAG: LuxR family transcriptional regulator [Phycisphaerales bacterium]|nr:LuxR family transcriptional regulator [Phycisphaerales bacterium]